MENTLKYEDFQDYEGLFEYDLKITQLNQSIKKIQKRISDKLTDERKKVLEDELKSSKIALTKFIEETNLKLIRTHKPFTFEPLCKEHYEI